MSNDDVIIRNNVITRTFAVLLSPLYSSSGSNSSSLRDEIQRLRDDDYQHRVCDDVVS